MTYSIRAYRGGDEAKVVKIVASVWGEYAVAKFNRLHPWFRRRKVGTVVDGDLILEFDGEPVGYTRQIPCQYLLAGQRVPAAFLADYVTHADHRGSGLLLARHLVKQPGILLVGAPVARTILIWRKVVGRPTKIAPIERCVLMLKPSEFLKRKGLPRVLGWPVNWVWRLKLIAVFRSFGRAARGALALSTEPTLPGEDEIDALFSAFARDFYAIAVRDVEYFRWRFCESGFNYRYVWLRDQGRLVGYAVYREGEVGGRKTLLILETMAVGDKPRYYAAMLELICQYGLASGFADVQTLNSGCVDFLRVMRRLGAVLKFEKEYLLASIVSNEPYATEMYEDKKWFISLADSDNEFVMYTWSKEW